MTNLPSCKEVKGPACIILINMMSHLKSFFHEGKWNRTKYSRKIIIAQNRLSLVSSIWEEQHFWEKLLLSLIAKHISKYDSYSERKTCSHNLLHYDLQPNVPSRIKFGNNAKRYLWGQSLLMSWQSLRKSSCWLAPKCCFFQFFSVVWNSSFQRESEQKRQLKPPSLAQKPFGNAGTAKSSRTEHLKLLLLRPILLQEMGTLSQWHQLFQDKPS